MKREARSEKRAAWTVAVAVVTCLVGAACAAQTPLTPTALSATIDTLATRGDSAGLATLAHRQCRSRFDGSAPHLPRGLLRRRWRPMAAPAWRSGALAQLGKAHEDVEREGHGYTHVIGIRAWKPGDDVSTVFRGCNGLYQSGCYHGVIQSYLTAEGTLDSTRAVTLCDADRVGREGALASLPVRPRPRAWLRDGAQLGLAGGADALRLVGEWLGPRVVLRRRLHGERHRVDGRWPPRLGACAGEVECGERRGGPLGPWRDGGDESRPGAWRDHLQDARLHRRALSLLGDRAEVPQRLLPAAGRHHPGQHRRALRARDRRVRQGRHAVASALLPEPRHQCERHVRAERRQGDRATAPMATRRTSRTASSGWSRTTSTSRRSRPTGSPSARMCRRREPTGRSVSSRWGSRSSVLHPTEMRTA